MTASPNRVVEAYGGARWAPSSRAIALIRTEAACTEEGKETVNDLLYIRDLESSNV